MATVTDALNGLKTRMETLPTYGFNPVAVYVHPTETRLLKEIVAFPTIVIGELLGDERNWTLPSFGRGRDFWRAAINVYLGPKAVMELAPDPGGTLDLHAGWAQGVTSAILAGNTLGGAAALVGEGGDVRIDYYVSGVIWNGAVYWGLHFAVPIWQEHTQTIAP